MENASLGAIFREFWVNYMAKLRPACPCSQGKLQIFPNMKKTAIFRDQLAMISWRTSGPEKILNCAVNKKRVALQICAWPFKVKLIDFGGGQKRVVRRRPGTSWNMLCGDKMVWPKKRAVWPFCSSGDLLKIDAISSWNTAAKRKKFVRRLLAWTAARQTWRPTKKCVLGLESLGFWEMGGHSQCFRAGRPCPKPRRLPIRRVYTAIYRHFY